LFGSGRGLTLKDHPAIAYS